MPFLKVVKREHKCSLPTSLNGKRGGRGIGPGTVWECPFCKVQWGVQTKKNGKINAVTSLPEMEWYRLKPIDYIKKGV